jgi:hypothetical protein
MSNGRDQDQVVLLEGPRRRLHHVSFDVRPGDLAAAAIPQSY